MGLFDFFRYRKTKPTVSSDSSVIEERHFTGVCDTPLNAKYTPESITTLGRRDIFVFGSNLAGYHARGAARVAFNRFGAVWGQREGLQGNSYAIPTTQGSVETIRPYIEKFIEFAEYEKALTFYVTKIGCGIDGFEVKDMAPLFKDAYNLPNVILPIEFAVYIENENRSIHPKSILDTMEAAHEERIKHFDSPIKVIGIGGAGINSVNRMIEAPLNFVEYSVIDADWMALRNSSVKLGGHLYGGNSCGINPRIVTEEDFYRYYDNSENKNIVHSLIGQSTENVIIVAGFGGKFGIAEIGSKWLANLCKLSGIPVIVVCTIPFDFEGQRRKDRALDAASSLINEGLNVKVIKAEELNKKYQNMSFIDCFSRLDEYVSESVNQICEELFASRNVVDGITNSIKYKCPCEVTTHCYGMTRTFADIILGLNEEKKYISPDQALSDLDTYLQRFRDNGDKVAFLAVKTIRHILHNDEVFIDGILNISRLRELVFEENNFLSAYDKAYDLYCREKMMNLITFLNEFRRYQRQIDIEYDLVAIENASKVKILKLSFCSPTGTPAFFEMKGATLMNYPVQFFVRAIRNLWPEIITDGVLDAAKMRKLMFGNHEEAVNHLGLEGAISRDFIEDSPCHPEVFVPKVMGTAPIYVKRSETGRFVRSCGEGKGPNSIPDWFEFQIAKKILEKDKSYTLVGNYYIPNYDNTLPVYGEYSGRIVFNTQDEKIKFIEDVKRGKNV